MRAPPVCADFPQKTESPDRSNALPPAGTCQEMNSVGAAAWVSWSRGGRDLTDTNTRKAWDSFQSDMKSLAGALRRNYKSADDQKKAAEINRSLQQLGQAAEAFFESLDTATRDPEVRASTKRAAKSFGSALAGTFRKGSQTLYKPKPQAPPH